MGGQDQSSLMSDLIDKGCQTMVCECQSASWDSSMEDARHGLRGSASERPRTQGNRDHLRPIRGHHRQVDSDEEPLVRPAVGRNVIPRLTQVSSAFSVTEWLRPATQVRWIQRSAEWPQHDPQCLPVFPPSDEQVLIWWSHQMHDG